MLIFINTTQLYSNLVIHVYKITTYLCLVLVVLVSPMISRVRLALLHIPSSFVSSYNTTHSLANISLILILEDKGDQHLVTKTKSSLCSMKQAFLGLPSLVKMQVGRGNIKSLDRNTNYSLIQNLGYTTLSGL